MESFVILMNVISKDIIWEFGHLKKNMYLYFNIFGNNFYNLKEKVTYILNDKFHIP